MKRLAPILLLILLVGCAHPAYDFKANPVGATAYYADQIIQLNGEAEKTIIAAEEAKMLATSDARTALALCRQIDEKGAQLAGALTELDKLSLTDVGRQPLLAKVSTLLSAINALAFNVVVPIGDNQTRLAVSEALQQVAKLLLTIQGAIR
jgi:phage FluMu protein gp41